MKSKKALILFIIFLFIYLPSCSTKESYGLDYEQQLLGSSGDYFEIYSQRERLELEKLFSYVDGFNGSEYTKNYLIGYIEGICVNEMYSSPYRCLNVAVPQETINLLMSEKLIDAYIVFDDAKVMFLKTLAENIDSSMLTDLNSEFHEKFSCIINEFKKVSYDHRNFTNEVQEMQYIQDLHTLADLLTEVSGLLTA